jgi:hypothetical protein
MASQDTIDVNELHSWYDLLHYRSIGLGLALVSKFLNECLV